MVIRPSGRSKFIGPQCQEKAEFQFASDSYIQQVPCGKCDLCLVDSRYSKALRIMLEAESWPGATYFITLTYNQENLVTAELVHNDWVQFMKDFRAEFCQAQYCDIRFKKGSLSYGKVRSKTFKKIRQVMCGEYGDTFGRKHFHGVLFNHTFSDMYFTGFYSSKGNPIYSSPSLEKVWSKGNVQVEEITFDLALYVGSYVTDKSDDPSANFGREKPQYGRFGRGIGRSWIEKYWRDVLVAGKVMLRQRDYPIPRAFLKWMKDICPTQLDKFCLENRLKRLQQDRINIEKGDGSLRRARAKGRIFKHLRDKRRKDSGDVRF